MSRNHSRPLFKIILLSVNAFILFISACSRGTPVATGGKLRVLATTSIVGDVVSQVGGDSHSPVDFDARRH